MEGIKLSDVEIMKILPVFMKDDETLNSISPTINEFIKEVIKRAPILTKWDKIDIMDDDELDELAWELNILWYEKLAPTDVKRRIIKNSDKVFSTLGTRWAVEEVISSYLGDAQMEEFWEYEGGKPHYFKISSNNPQITMELEELFLRVLEKVKRKSQWLEKIGITLESSGIFYVGTAYSELSEDTIRITDEVGDMSLPVLQKYVGVSYGQFTDENIQITK